jgi:hypothetical protein
LGKQGALWHHEGAAIELRPLAVPAAQPPHGRAVAHPEDGREGQEAAGPKGDHLGDALSVRAGGELLERGGEVPPLRGVAEHGARIFRVGILSRRKRHRPDAAIEGVQQGGHALLEGDGVGRREGLFEAHLGDHIGHEAIARDAAHLFEQILIHRRGEHDVDAFVVDPEGAQAHGGGDAPGQAGHGIGLGGVRPGALHPRRAPSDAQSLGHGLFLERAALQEERVERAPVHDLLLQGVLEHRYGDRLPNKQETSEAGIEALRQGSIHGLGAASAPGLHHRPNRASRSPKRPQGVQNFLCPYASLAALLSAMTSPVAAPAGAGDP